MRKWLDIVLKYPLTIVSVWILISVLMGWNIPRLELEPDVKEMLPKNLDIVLSMNEIEELFGSSEIVLLSLASKDLFNPRTLAGVDSLTREIESLELVDKAVSLTNVQDVIGSEFGFEVRPLMENFDLAPNQIHTLEDRIRQNDLLYDTVVSRDFRCAAIMVMLAGSETTNADELIYQELNRLRLKYGHLGEIFMAGLSITRREVAHTMQTDIKKLFPWGLILMIFFLVFSFRSWIGAFLPFILMGITVVIALGLMAILGMKFTFIGLMIPVMLIAITSSYSIHIITHYFDSCSECSDQQKKDVIRETILLLKTPVLLSGLTTLIGFLSLQSHVLPPAQELGILVSFGIAIAFLQCISFLPAALCLLPSPVFKSGRQSTKLLNDRNLNRWGILLVRFRNYILIVTVLVILGVATGIPRVRIDTNPVNFFNWKSEFRQASEFIDREFGGSSQIALLAEGDIKDPDFLKEMEKVTAYLQTKPMVTQVTSIVDQLKMMNKAFHGDSVAYKIIPATRDKVAQYLFLYSITGDSKDLDRFVDYDYERAQIMARVRETGSTEAHRLYLEILDFLQREMNPAHFPAVTGMAAFIGVLAEMVVKGQIWSLLASIVLVFLCTALIFRSFSAGLLSIMPLSGAIILLFGLMGYLNIHLDMATVMLSSIMIGVGVDYTVHYIYRYRREVGLGASIQEAVPLTIRTSGKGILYNALSVIIGFAVLLLSGFVPIYFFGFLIVLSIVACLLGALILIPVVTLIIKPAFIKKRRKNEALAR